MDSDQLAKLRQVLKISADQILREEAEMEILSELAKHRLSSKLVFYGGTALRLAYGSPRFSEDIDLIAVKPAGYGEYRAFIDSLIEKKDNWSLKDVKNKRKTYFSIILISDRKLKHNFSVRIELHKPAVKVKMNAELTLIKSPASPLEPLLLVPSLAELERLKLDALAGRQKARDIFDLWYIARLRRKELVLPEKIPAYGKRAFTNELKVFLPKNFDPLINELYEKITG